MQNRASQPRYCTPARQDFGFRLPIPGIRLAELLRIGGVKQYAYTRNRVYDRPGSRSLRPLHIGPSGRYHFRLFVEPDFRGCRHHEPRWETTITTSRPVRHSDFVVRASVSHVPACGLIDSQLSMLIGTRLCARVYRAFHRRTDLSGLLKFQIRYHTKTDHAHG